MAKSVQPFWAFVTFPPDSPHIFLSSFPICLTWHHQVPFFLTYYPSSLSYTLFFLWFHPSMQVGSFWTNNKRYKGTFKSMEMKWYWKGIKRGREGTPPLGPHCFTKPLGVRTYICIACCKVHLKVQFCLFCNEPLWLEPSQRKQFWNFQNCKRTSPLPTYKKFWLWAKAMGYGVMLLGTS